MSKKKFINKTEAQELYNALGDEYVVVNNPGYIHPAFEIYPLAPKITRTAETLTAFVMDMDGTTTTTEELCLHSLEFMVRRMCGKMTKQEWIGLDHTVDYPHIIGNSTTKHVEYLIKKYSHMFTQDNIIRSFIRAALWTLRTGKDAQRKAEVKTNLVNYNLGGILTDPDFARFMAQEQASEVSEDIVGFFFDKYASGFSEINFSSMVRTGIDIYYHRYHVILEKIRNGEGKMVSEEVFADPEKHLIEAMPGIMVFVSMIKGWLGEDILCLTDKLLADYKLKSHEDFSGKDIETVKAQLLSLAKRYEEKPAKAAIVTSSIFYEADIVMTEVMKVISGQIEKSALPEAKKNFLKEKFSDYRNVYDGFVTASDSNEIRLKPHRDLYSIALHQLNVPKDQFNLVAGFEDSESGTIAIRAAGIGMCIAVPFAQTAGHDLEAASVICKGGLPEVLLQHNLFTN